jgi:hypothetical protein
VFTGVVVLVRYDVVYAIIKQPTDNDALRLFSVGDHSVAQQCKRLVSHLFGIVPDGRNGDVKNVGVGQSVNAGD